MPARRRLRPRDRLDAGALRHARREDRPVLLDAATSELAQGIAAASGVTLAYGKQAFYRQLDAGLAEAYELCADVMTRNALDADAQEGMCAFLEKREPVWADR